MLVIAAIACGWTLGGVAVPARTTRLSSSVRCDSDRCYYGAVDAQGNTLDVLPKKRRGGPAPKPDASLTPQEIVDAQFACLSSGSFADIEAAFSFLSPSVITKYEMTPTKFREILSGPAFDGLIGCTDWT